MAPRQARPSAATGQGSAAGNRGAAAAPGRNPAVVRARAGNGRLSREEAALMIPSFADIRRPTGAIAHGS
ncbi:hypothetical protein [Lysobacter gummosus]|uniref:hypothetical protein n=1 Tax=Lysobacter gummosus TaxID=262324 RepID=UPI00362EAC87